MYNSNNKDTTTIVGHPTVFFLISMFMVTKQEKIKRGFYKYFYLCDVEFNLYYLALYPQYFTMFINIL